MLSTVYLETELFAVPNYNTNTADFSTTKNNLEHQIKIKKVDPDRDPLCYKGGNLGYYLVSSRTRSWKCIDVILNVQRHIEQIPDFLRLILVSEVFVPCSYARSVQRGILFKYAFEMLPHTIVPTVRSRMEDG